MASKLRSGGCLCGAVRFTARLEGTGFGACHCEMCRRWTGAAFLGMTVPAANVDWQGSEHIATRATSAWAMRAWCRDCGSGVYYRLTQGSQAANLELPIGLFDDANGLEMTGEIWIDHKPDSFAFSGAHRLLTRAEVLARFPAISGAEGAA